MASTLLDELRNLNYSNQMDNNDERGRWAALCNLLEDFVENVGTAEDLPAHDRRVAREGFKSDAEVCGYMADRLADHAAKLICLSEQMRLLTTMYSLRELCKE